MFIKDWRETQVEVSAILRPRRFGKSTNLSMLNSFFSFNAKAEDYERFLIGKEKEFVKEHCGKYPVVFMNMKAIGGYNWEEMLSRIWLRLGCTIHDQKRNLTKEDIKFIEIDCYDSKIQPNENIAANFLKRLTKCLHEKYNKQVIVLMDEYDAPLNHAFSNGFYDKALSFFKEFYSYGFKNNPALEKACLIGIIEIKGTGILSELNNSRVYSSGEEEYSQYFGFTKEEITDFFDGDEKRIKDVMDWYYGYYMGSHQVINPWSCMNSISRNAIDSYWINTSSESIHTIVRSNFNDNLFQILTKLYAGNDHEIGELSSIENYDALFSEVPTDTSINRIVLGFFVHAGYLTYREGKVLIPNKEIKKEWRDYVFGMTGMKIQLFLQKNILGALQNTSFDIKSLETGMRHVLMDCSHFDTRCENPYRTFYLGVFTIVCDISGESAYKEAGNGRYDIRIAFPELKRLFVFGFKRSSDINDFEKDAKEGLKQIQDKENFRDPHYRGWTCFLIGVSFNKKRMSNLVYEESLISNSFISRFMSPVKKCFYMKNVNDNSFKSKLKKRS